MKNDAEMMEFESSSSWIFFFHRFCDVYALVGL